MPLLTVNNVKKIYTTRFGGNHIQALSNVSFSAPTRKSMPSPPLAWAMPWL